MIAVNTNITQRSRRAGWLSLELVIATIVAVGLFVALSMAMHQGLRVATQRVAAQQRNLAIENLLERMWTVPYQQLDSQTLQELAEHVPSPRGTKWELNVTQLAETPLNADPANPAAGVEVVADAGPSKRVTVALSRTASKMGPAPPTRTIVAWRFPDVEVDVAPAPATNDASDQEAE